jgi:hypothetical protein
MHPHPRQQRSPERPLLRIACSALSALTTELTKRRPEAGGILLGPIDGNAITEFCFDPGGTCTGVTYAPDAASLNRLMREEWLPRGIDMKGFAHSHPENYDHLSPGDLRYIARLLEINPDMEQFAAPIVLPSRFIVRPFVVRRGAPLHVEEAILEITDA